MKYPTNPSRLFFATAVAFHSDKACSSSVLPTAVRAQPNEEEEDRLFEASVSIDHSYTSRVHVFALKSTS